MRLVSVSVRSVVVLAGIALLSAPALAQGTARQRAACTRGAFRFCARDIPNVRRIEACMIRNFDRLSPRCQAVFLDPYGHGERYGGRYYD
jgi:hypothetical protein